MKAHLLAWDTQKKLLPFIDMEKMWEEEEEEGL